MNAPDRFELFVLPEGSKKVEMTLDEKIPNAATFKIEREDHTLGNMLRQQLMLDTRVMFAGYKVPHPLEHNFIIKIQAQPGVRPEDCLNDAMTQLLGELRSMRSKFETEVVRFRTMNQ